MAEESIQAPPAGAEPSPQTPPAGTPPAPEATEEPSDESAASPEALKKLRSEAKNLRDRLKEAEAKAEAAQAKNSEYEKAQLSEAERLQKEAQEAQERASALEARLVEAEIGAAARDLGFANPDHAARLIDRSALKIKDGKPENASELLTKLLEDSPYLKGEAKPGMPATEKKNPSGTEAAAAEARQKEVRTIYGRAFEGKQPVSR